MEGCFSCSFHQIVRYGQIELVGRLEISVASEGHYVIFAEALLEPVCYGSFSDVVKGAMLYAGFFQDTVKMPGKIVGNAGSGTYEGPLATWAKSLLDVIIPFYGN